MRTSERVANRLRDAVRRRASRVCERLPRAAAASAPPPEHHTRARYHSLALLADRYGYRDHELSAAELSVFSQNGEDGVLAELFSRIGTHNRFFVEFGIETGVEGNSVLLADALGWSGVYIESDDEYFSLLAAKYANNKRIRTLQATVTPANIDELLKSASVPPEIDLLSIDVDGPDFFVWQALSAVSPRVVVIEYNSAIASDHPLIAAEGSGCTPREWDRTTFFGCSLAALQELGRTKGYSLVHAEMAGVNAFFVRDDALAPVANFVPTMRSPNYYLQGRGHPPDPLQRPFVKPNGLGGLSAETRASSNGI